MGLPVSARAQAAYEVVPTAQIPRSYESWSLFLICNPKWMLDKGDKGVVELFNAYKAFGAAIGEKNLAVWFWKKPAQTPTLENTDIGRMVSYCQKYHLLPSKTPQVIATTNYPDEPKIANWVAVNLGTNAQDSASALTALTDQLLSTGLKQADLDENERWRRFITAGAAAINSVGCYLNKVSLSFNVGVAKVEMAHSNDKGCKPSG
jgi:hypothetical protein